MFGVFDQVHERLGFGEATDLFVYPEAKINAYALHRLRDDSSHVLSITSDTIRSMSDPELCFTLGHEIGHLALGHCRVMMAQMMLSRDGNDEKDGARQMPQLLERRLDKWQRLAEISADRVGYLACGCDLSVAVSAFFRMASGLGPEHLRFDLSSFLEQLAHLERLDRREVTAQFSHPATPVRARALQLYAEAGGPDASREQLDEVDREVARIASLMDFELSTELGVQMREFLLSAGLLAAHSDGQISEDEQHALTQLLLQVSGDPEAHFERVQTTEQAQQILADACVWLRENASRERFALFGQLCHVVAVDGVVTETESAFMHSVAKQLDIPLKAANEILNEVLSGHVRKRSKSNVGAFGLR